MNEVLLIKNGESYDITELVKSITWSGDKTKPSRTFNFGLVDTEKGGHKRAKLEEGDGILFRIDGIERFRGYIFKISGGPDTMDITCYDKLIYISNNKDEALFVGKKASDIARKLCNDFGIPIGEIADTGYVIPYYCFDGDTLYDMIMSALKVTYEHTKVKYAIRAREGKFDLYRVSENLYHLTLETGINIGDYSYDSSIEESRTKVKLIVGEQDKTSTIVVSDNKAISKYGVMQHYEKLNENLTYAQAKEKADKLLEELKSPKQSLSISNVIGIPDIITGVSVYVYIPDIGVHRGFFVENDSHSFEGKKHVMSLQLKKSYELPDISAGSTEKPEEKKKDKK